MYETVIGLEVHFELATKTKLFCGCENRFAASPNTLCCPTCLGLPGSLPVLNKRAVEYALMAGLALNCGISKRIVFDRKNYFYPDMPNGYQVSQFYCPLCLNGKLTFFHNGKTKTVGIREIHLEDDAGKLIHGDGVTKIDYNRAGVPLIEVVTDPDMNSAEETVAFLEALRLTMLYLGVSDCKMQEGSMRVDVNLSVHKIGEPLGTRTEMKNLNSFKAVAHAINCEEKRQREIIENGGAVDQETRRFDDLKGVSYVMRSKEQAEDYRFFPDSNLPAVSVEKSLLDEIKLSLPELPETKKRLYISDFGLSDTDAEILVADKCVAEFFEKTAAFCGNRREAANRIIRDVMGEINLRQISLSESCLTPEKLGRIIALCENGEVSRKISREIMSVAFGENIDIDRYVDENGLSQITDPDIIKSAVEKVILDNPKAVADFKNGKKQVFGNLVGLTMKELCGRGAPQIINQIVEEMLKMS